VILKLAVQTREIGNKSARKNLRKGGNIPAIIYSEGQPGIPISVPTNEFFKLYKKSIGEMAVFHLMLEGKEHFALIKARQIHPVTRNFVHVDFLELKKDKEISLPVPINFIGTPSSLKSGGVLEKSLQKLQITCRPGQIPNDIPLSIDELKIGDTIYVKDIKVKDIVIQDSGDLAIVAVNAVQKDEI